RPPTHTLLLPTHLSTLLSYLFFSRHTSPTNIYTLSLHDALPISKMPDGSILASGASPGTDTYAIRAHTPLQGITALRLEAQGGEDRKSTRLNSSHQIISYAVFCLKKKKKK